VVIKSRFAGLKLLALASLWAGALILGPSVAEAQARGNLQATAVVVNTRPAFDALQTAQAAAQQWLSPRAQAQSTVTTLASVSVTETPSTAQLTERPTLVVTVDYSRN
jgi:hypothetical protein